MTIKKAGQIALKAFGPRALIDDRKKPALNEKGQVLRGRFIVGTRGWIGFDVKGSGATWEEAFEKAGVNL